MSDNILTYLNSGLLVAIVTTLAAYVINRKKAAAEIRNTDQETDKTAADAWKDLLEPYQEEVARLRKENIEQKERVDMIADNFAAQSQKLTKRVEELERKVIDLEREKAAERNYAERLANQVRSLGHVPVPRTILGEGDHRYGLD